MAKNIELLLLETVENLGIVGDIVKVKPGYARNYLLPHGVAQPPSAKKIEELKAVRAQAQSELAALRSQREQIIQEITGASITLQRSCNDQGALYGSVSQRDISDALIAGGFGVDTAAVRLAHSIRRIGTYHVPIQFDRDLTAEVTLLIKPDRALEGFDEAGDPIEPDEPEVPAESERRPSAQDDFGDFGDDEDRPRKRRRD